MLSSDLHTLPLSTNLSTHNQSIPNSIQISELKTPTTTCILQFNFLYVSTYPCSTTTSFTIVGASECLVIATVVMVASPKIQQIQRLHRRLSVMSPIRIRPNLNRTSPIILVHTAYVSVHFGFSKADKTMTRPSCISSNRDPDESLAAELNRAFLENVPAKYTRACPARFVVLVRIQRPVGSLCLCLQ